MLGEMLSALAPHDGGTYIDGTFGAGGYSGAILESCDCGVVAFDRDESAIPRAEEFKKKYGARFRFFNERFSQIERVMRENSIAPADGLALDLGVSSMQIDDAKRGFSFMRDGPLSMRMGGNATDAACVLNTLREDEIANIIYKYGEERRSRAIARKIAEARRTAPIETTLRLAGIIKGAVGARQADRAVPKVFQALRIHVNDELGELERALESSRRILAPDGRLVVVSFHSLEDRLAKNFMNGRAGGGAPSSRYLPDMAENGKIYFKPLAKNAILPSKEETERNPRSASAKLRAAVRIRG
jgi:16S rRNA (cytosine1402-N4)-methyltransferase